MTRFPIVEIAWSDYTTRGGWSNAWEIEDFCEEPEQIYLTAGYLIDKDGDRVILAESIAPNGDLYDLSRIPASQVRGIEVIRGLDEVT